jgi:hypothetical protein
VQALNEKQNKFSAMIQTVGIHATIVDTIDNSIKMIRNSQPLNDKATSTHNIIVPVSGAHTTTRHHRHRK